MLWNTGIHLISHKINIADKQIYKISKAPKCITVDILFIHSAYNQNHICRHEEFRLFKYKTIWLSNFKTLPFLPLLNAEDDSQEIPFQLSQTTERWASVNLHEENSNCQESNILSSTRKEIKITRRLRRKLIQIVIYLVLAVTTYKMIEMFNLITYWVYGPNFTWKFMLLQTS